MHNRTVYIYTMQCSACRILLIEQPFPMNSKWIRCTCDSFPHCRSVHMCQQFEHISSAKGTTTIVLFYVHASVIPVLIFSHPVCDVVAFDSAAIPLNTCAQRAYTRWLQLTDLCIDISTLLTYCLTNLM